MIKSAHSTRTSPSSETPAAGGEGRIHDAAHASGSAMHQIGEVAERVGLSLRTVRYYEEMGLVVPSGRTQGGFRLYTEADIERLALVKQMKPLGFSLEQMRDLLEVRERLQSQALPAAERADLLEKLSGYSSAAADQCQRLRSQLEIAEGFARTLRNEVDRHGARTTQTR